METINLKNDSIPSGQINKMILNAEVNHQFVGKVIAISISKKKGIPKTNIDSANLKENYGIDGDALR